MRAEAVVAEQQYRDVVLGPSSCVPQELGEDGTEDGLGRDRPAAYGRRQGFRQWKEGAVHISRVFDPVRVEEQGFSWEEGAAGHGREFGREREHAQWGHGVGTGQEFRPTGTEQVRPGMPTVEGVDLTVRGDLQQEYGHELLGVLVVLGADAVAQMPGQGSVEAAEDSGQIGFVVDGLAEAAEHGGDGVRGGQTVSTHITHHHTHTVLGGDHVVQITATARPALGGEPHGGGGQPVDPRGHRPDRPAPRGPGDRPGLPHLTEHDLPNVQDEAGASGEDDGTADDTGTEPTPGPPIGTTPPGPMPRRSPSLASNHAVGPPSGPDSV